MTEQEVRQLNEDLGRSIQVDIRGRKRPDGTQWFRQALRSRGYRAFVNPNPGVLIVGKDNVNQEDWTKPIEEVGEIHIWVDRSGPSIYWETSDDGPLQRTK